jgi:hypothetical protein
LGAAIATGYRREHRPVDQAGAVGVTLFPDQAGRIDVLAAGIDAIDRAGKGQSGPERGFERLRAQALAAPDPARSGRIRSTVATSGRRCLKARQVPSAA